MYSIRPNLLIRKIYPAAIWRIRTKEKKIFLTFDDGPVPEITPRVLSLLKRHRAKATFFCIGANIDKHPNIFRQIISEGHSIGNHTYNHLNGWKTNTKAYLENITQCENTLRSTVYGLHLNDRKQETINRKPFFRPPYGKMKPSQYSMINAQYSMVMWDILSGDFDESISQEQCLKNVITNIRPGSIVVFHDSLKAKKNLLYTLPKFLDTLHAKGFSFCGLSPGLFS